MTDPNPHAGETLATIDDLDVAGQRVRGGAPAGSVSSGTLRSTRSRRVADDTRIRAALTTIEKVRHLAELIDVSTGGGATLELLEGRQLPGVQALLRATAVR